MTLKEYAAVIAEMAEQRPDIEVVSRCDRNWVTQATAPIYGEYGDLTAGFGRFKSVSEQLLQDHIKVNAVCIN